MLLCFLHLFHSVFFHCFILKVIHHAPVDDVMEVSDLDVEPSKDNYLLERAVRKS